MNCVSEEDQEIQSMAIVMFRKGNVLFQVKPLQHTVKPCQGMNNKSFAEPHIENKILC